MFSSNADSAPDQFSDLKFNAVQTEEGKFVTDQIGLVLPTSICSGQIARLITEKLNSWLAQKSAGADGLEKFGVSRFVCLPHTEGCGKN